VVGLQPTDPTGVRVSFPVDPADSAVHAAPQRLGGKDAWTEAMLEQPGSIQVWSPSDTIPIAQSGRPGTRARGAPRRAASPATPDGKSPGEAAPGASTRISYGGE
jgi:hypothetical protein